MAGNTSIMAITADNPRWRIVVALLSGLLNFFNGITVLFQIIHIFSNSVDSLR
jgi:hypothetical protein